MKITAEDIETATEYDQLAEIDSPTREQNRRMYQILADLTEAGVKADAYLEMASMDIMEGRPAITLVEYLTRLSG